jgi:hypothetical protein
VPPGGLQPVGTGFDVVIATHGLVIEIMASRWIKIVVPDA